MARSETAAGRPDTSAGRPRSPGGRARRAFERLGDEYPGTAAELCELDFRDDYELLVATIMSAQTTDVRVNMVTPELFRRHPTPADLAVADPAEVEEIIRSTGFYRNKTKAIIGMAAAVVERHGGRIPKRMADLVELPGVGRKTANVLRSVAHGEPGLPVDTHVIRLARRLGLSDESDPVKLEHILGAMVRARDRGLLSLRLILHGRRVCTARNPACERCVLADFCPSAGTG